MGYDYEANAVVPEVESMRERDLLEYGEWLVRKHEGEGGEAFLSFNEHLRKKIRPKLPPMEVRTETGKLVRYEYLPGTGPDPLEEVREFIAWLDEWEKSFFGRLERYRRMRNDHATGGR